MFNHLLTSQTSNLLKQTAKFAELRQDVLAGNVANIDTPGYRMRDLPVADFQNALKKAYESQTAQPASLHPPLANPENPLTDLISPLATSNHSTNFFPETLFQASEKKTQPGITFQDANNRSIEQQMTQISKNSMLQSFATELLNLQYNQLQSVISEQV